MVWDSGGGREGAGAPKWHRRKGPFEVLEWGRTGGLALESALCGLQRASVGYLVKPSFVSLVVFSSGTAETLGSFFWQSGNAGRTLGFFCLSL